MKKAPNEITKEMLKEISKRASFKRRRSSTVFRRLVSTDDYRPHLLGREERDTLRAVLLSVADVNYRLTAGLEKDRISLEVAEDICSTIRGTQELYLKLFILAVVVPKRFRIMPGPETGSVHELLMSHQRLCKRLWRPKLSFHTRLRVLMKVLRIELVLFAQLTRW